MALTSCLRLPIVDIPRAAMSMGGQPACANTPAFIASDPMQQESNFGWMPVPCASPLLTAKTSDSLREEDLG